MRGGSRERMKYLDEYRDEKIARGIVAEIDPPRHAARGC